jgi:PAS domain S-box-containing protein
LRSKAIIKEKYTRRRIIITLVLIITGFSIFYNYLSITFNLSFKNHLINLKINELKQDLNRHYLNCFNRYYSLGSSPQVLNSIIDRDSLSFFRSLDSTFKQGDFKPWKNICIHSSNGNLIFGSKCGHEIGLSYNPCESKIAVNSNVQKFFVNSDGVYQLVSIPVNKGNAGFIEIGIEDQEDLKTLENKKGFKVLVVLKPELANTVLKKNNPTINYYNGWAVISLDKENKILENQKLNKIIVGKRVITGYDNKYYALINTGDLTLSSNKTAGYIIIAVDVTNIEVPFYNLLIRSVLLSLLIIVFSYILISLFFNRLIARFFNIEEIFEREIADRTKEVLNTNIELHQIFNSTANGLRIINTNYDIIRVNESFCRISGTIRESIEGEKCYDIFPGVFCHTTNCPLDRIREGERAVETEEVRFKKGGKKIRCQHSAVPFWGSNGELLGIIEDFKDITEKFEVENMLRKTEEQFSAFMDNMPIGVFIKDYSGVLLYQNKYLTNVFGFDKFIGKDISKELNPEWGNRISLEDEKVLQHGKIEFEETLTDKEGHDKTFVTHKFRFHGLDNNWKIGGVSIDITKKKITEHFLYVLSKAIKNSPVSIVITNPLGSIEFINPSFTNLTGHSLTDSIHKNLLEMKVEYNSGKNLFTAIECVKNGNVWKGEIQLQNKKGEHFWVLASFAPIFNRRGEVSHGIASMEDITSRKENERELLLSKTKAEESDKLKTAFLSNLSHEIRTPLNAIIGFSSLLTDSDLSIIEKKNLSDVLYKNSNDLLKLIENLIEISEIETGQLAIKKGECCVNKLMTELQETYLNEDKKGKYVKLNFKKEIRSEDFTILTDPLRLKQVLNNLISNATKFTENGFIEFGYTFKDERTLMFYIIDTGIGIEPEKQKYIFNPFRQADDSNTRRFGGMGLGLAISKHIVEKLGGKIWLTSIPGSGSTFFFTIPYIPVRFKFEPEQKEEKKQTYNWKNKKILVADDIDSNYVYLKAAIKHTSAEVIWAKTGIEAVELVRNNPDINIVLMDVVMPEMDGYEATKLIKLHNNHLPVVCQTAYPNNDNNQIAIDCGFDSFMAKPIKIDGMLQIIDKFISQN